MKKGRFKCYPILCAIVAVVKVVGGGVVKVARMTSSGRTGHFTCATEPTIR